MLRTALPLGLLAALALSGCPNNTPPDVYSIADWQVRCDSEMTGCTNGPSRLVTGFNGMSGNTVSCTVTEAAATRRVSFRTGSRDAVSGVAYSIELAGATFPRGGGATAGGMVTVVEGANTYVAVAGGTAPSVSQPCQVTAEFGTDMSTGSTLLEVQILCDHMPNRADPVQLRAVFRGAGSPDPGFLQFFDCRGLSHDP